MHYNFMTSLRIAVSVLAWIIFLAPINANAYTSNGSDGQFQPTASMILDSTQQIFNFTSIFIPSGVTVSFSGLTSGQPIELLATGNVDISGTLDMGANSLWIETPGNISFSGILNSSGGALLLASGSGSINVSGIMNAPGGSITLRNGSDTLAGKGGDIKGGAIISLDGGDVIRSGRSGDGDITGGARISLDVNRPSIGTFTGTFSIRTGGDIDGGGNLISGITLLSPVPEPGVWVMLLSGFCALFAVSRQRNQNTRIA